MKSSTAPCHLQFGLFKLRRGHALPQWDENIQKIQCRVQLQFQRAAPERNVHQAVEHRVSQQPCLHQICLGDAKFGVQRLEVPIVQQRHLDRPVDGQRVLQQRAHFLATCASNSVPRIPDHPLPTTASTAALISEKPAR